MQTLVGQDEFKVAEHLQGAEGAGLRKVSCQRGARGRPKGVRQLRAEPGSTFRPKGASIWLPGQQSPTATSLGRKPLPSIAGGALPMRALPSLPSVPCPMETLPFIKRDDHGFLLPQGPRCLYRVGWFVSPFVP